MFTPILRKISKMSRGTLGGWALYLENILRGWGKPMSTSILRQTFKSWRGMNPLMVVDGGSWPLINGVGLGSPY
jgi:hypothetical protein